MGNCKCIRQNEENKELLNDNFNEIKPGKFILNNPNLEKIIQQNPNLLKAIVRIQSLYRGKKIREQTEEKKKLLRGAKKKSENLINYSSEIKTIPKSPEENGIQVAQPDITDNRIVKIKYNLI